MIWRIKQISEGVSHWGRQHPPQILELTHCCILNLTLFLAGFHSYLPENKLIRGFPALKTPLYFNSIWHHYFYFKKYGKRARKKCSHVTNKEESTVGYIFLEFFASKKGILNETETNKPKKELKHAVDRFSFK